MPVIPVLGRLGPEDCYKFKASLGYSVRLSQKTVTALILNREAENLCVKYVMNKEIIV